MSQTTTLRVLFCIGVNQNFFDATPAEAKQVWGAFGVMCGFSLSLCFLSYEMVIFKLLCSEGFCMNLMRQEIQVI